MSEPIASTATDTTCPVCAEPTVADASFCEACGADLIEPAVVPEPCVSCAADGSQILDGYCMECGHKQPGPRDHLEVDLGWVAGVTDRGKRHHHNEDSMALAVVGGTAILVVCDGVSSTDRSEEASQAAADASLAVLRAGVEGGDDPARSLEQAAAAAQAAVLEVPAGDTNASSTFVAAIAAPVPDGVAVTVAWLGDSRAYWVGASPELLTIDDNWANDMAASGTLTRAEADAHPHAHTLTRWIGADAPIVPPRISTHRTGEPGSLLVCSDGLWNYAAAPRELADRTEWSAPTPLDQVVGLAAFANEAGGHDNITAVVASFDGRADAGADVLDSHTKPEGEGDGRVHG